MDITSSQITGQGANDNNGGYNGITLRWAMYAYNNGYLSQLGGYLPWAQVNIDDASAHRDSQELIWDDWVATTPATGGGSAVHSWDCSSAMVGMFDVPTPQVDLPGSSNRKKAWTGMPVLLSRCSHRYFSATAERQRPAKNAVILSSPQLTRNQSIAQQRSGSVLKFKV